MYNQCESCKRDIQSADDCKLYSNDGVTIHTLCTGCYSARKKEKQILQ